MTAKKILSATHNLEATISKYAQIDAEVADFLKIIKPLLNDIKGGTVRLPIKWRDIPGSRCFTEGSLRKYRDLERDYSEFRFALTD